MKVMFTFVLTIFISYSMLCVWPATYSFAGGSRHYQQANKCRCVGLEIQVRIASGKPWPAGGVWVEVNDSKHFTKQVDSTGYVLIKGLPRDDCGVGYLKVRIKGYLEEYWDLYAPRCGIRRFDVTLSKCRGGWYHHGTTNGRNIPPENCWR